MLPLRHIGSLGFACTLVFVIAGGGIFGRVHPKPPTMKSVRVLHWSEERDCRGAANILAKPCDINP